MSPDVLNGVVLPTVAGLVLAAALGTVKVARALIKALTRAVDAADTVGEMTVELREVAASVRVAVVHMARCDERWSLLVAAGRVTPGPRRALDVVDAEVI